ncbi:hypothetical protein [Sodalinema gerasimenkoae]|uniref:hypothetical protein n=1 Tax=Sodalinema gerasimenkoae TaxID=2862348 RepID=UPI00135CC49D|nr:hypothetical protein [Sodalinema gerasimenkoae]MCC5899718.1 hypothetical protein [Phormidium sp. BM_Day4_Bin.17]UCJ11362.1 MAG: hypothetical protein JWS08_16565 [Phormidium sp. PBR-2020]
MSNLFPDPFSGGPNPFNETSGLPNDPVYQNSEVPDGEFPETPIQRSDKTASILRRYFTILVLGGLVLGLIFSIGVIRVIQHFGLDDVPVQVD